MLPSPNWYGMIFKLENWTARFDNSASLAVYIVAYPINSFASWIILHAFWLFAFFSKSTLEKNTFHEYHQSFKQLGSRVRSVSGSKLFATIIIMSILAALGGLIFSPSSPFHAM